ncbi:MAG TPA: hypothetical protein VGD86_08475, partial [Devosia sp.]
IHNPPPLSEEGRRELEKLAAMPDDQIDFSDIPKSTPEQLARALRNPDFYPPLKLDRRVIESFQERSIGKGDMLMQINHVLLDYIAAQRRPQRKPG